jgi:hypothetical protein
MLSKLEKFEKHTMTCKLMIQDLDDQHVLVFFPLECVFSGKSITQPPWVMCTPRIHIKSMFEKGDFVGFRLVLIVIWRFDPCL